MPGPVPAADAAIRGVAAAVAPAAAAAPAAAEAAAPVAAKAAGHLGAVAGVVAAAAPGMTKTGWFGLSAGAAGIIVTLLDTWKGSVGSQKGLDTSSLLGPTTFAIGGGTAMLLLGEKGGFGSLTLRNGMRGAGVALVLGGLAGAIVGALQTYRSPVDRSARKNPLLQAPSRFDRDLPSSPAQLDGVEMAAGEVIAAGRKVKRLSIYLDTPTATRSTATSLGEAIGQARAAAQADDKDRSQAVIQTKDGAYWIARLSGDLDQVDGRYYADGNDFDKRYPPNVTKKQTALQAIVGVESRFIFPESLDAGQKPQDPGAIPWIPPATSTTTPAPGPTTTTPKEDGA